MDTPAASKAPLAADSGSTAWRDILSDALRYWEPRRILYNLVLVAVFLGYVIYTWPHFRGVLAWQPLLKLWVLAALANVCYCAAYLADIPLQCSASRNRWRRWRWALWLVGVLFAAALTLYWTADEIYPDFDGGRSAASAPG